MGCWNLALFLGALWASAVLVAVFCTGYCSRTSGAHLCSPCFMDLNWLLIHMTIRSFMHSSTQSYSFDPNLSINLFCSCIQSPHTPTITPPHLQYLTLWPTSLAHPANLHSLCLMNITLSTFHCIPSFTQLGLGWECVLIH